MFDAPRVPRSAADPGAAVGTGATFARREIAPGLTLHLNTDDRRKTNLVNVFWVGPLDETVTSRALLPNVLMRGTQRLPSLQALTRETERLFGSSLSTDVRKIGERHVIQFRLEFVNDRYLPGGETILADAIEFLREVIESPRLDGDAFPPDVIEQEKETHRRLIEGLLNDKRSFAVQRCLEETCRDEAFRLHDQGRTEDLAAIEGAGLADLWRTVRTGSETHVYFSGHLPLDDAETALAPLLADRGRGPDPLPPLPGPRAPEGPVRELVERMPLNQAKLVFSFRTGVPFDDPRVPGLVIGNGVLGSFAHSKLFVNVREGASLCYYAGSSLERTQSMMFISSGIDMARYAEARSLIEKQLEDVRAGDFTDDELNATKLAFDSRLRMLEDSPSALMDIHLAWEVNGASYDLEKYRHDLQAVTRDDVVAAFEEIRPEVVYLLGPEEG